jgi:DNA-directed RNA polymerase specialized sigma24 family protein
MLVARRSRCRARRARFRLMRKEWTLDQESFERMLAWLDPDRERAGRRYEAIRSRLMRIFTSRGCAHAEELADETINRVCDRVAEVAGDYSGDPALYFYGVATKVHLEYVRRNARVAVLPPREAPEDREAAHACLDRCLARFPSETRELALEYYRAEGQAKIDLRRGLAERSGVGLNALRIRMHRLRNELQACVRECLDSQGLS